MPSGMMDKSRHLKKETMKETEISRIKKQRKHNEKAQNKLTQETGKNQRKNFEIFNFTIKLSLVWWGWCLGIFWGFSWECIVVVVGMIFLISIKDTIIMPRKYTYFSFNNWLFLRANLLLFFDDKKGGIKNNNFIKFKKNPKNLLKNEKKY